jgi:type I restriction enzyme M protein
MNKQQLASKIWESANKMRSKIEANEYKDYILGFIFYKYLSDTEVRFCREEGFSDADIKALAEADAETVDFIQKGVGYFIAYENLFSTWIEKGKDFDVSNVRDALSAFSRLIHTTHRKVFDRILDTLQTGLSKLGDSSGSQTKAISDLIQLIKVIPMDGRQDYDVLGFIYEYLISMFAANAGKKAGEFYTPHEVSLLMSEVVANHLKARRTIDIYDPTSGSGSLLINIGRSVAKHIADANNVKYYAQEIKENTYNLTRMNLVMRGILPGNITTRNGDTLEDDWPFFEDSDPVGTYNPLYVDAVVSNPPYSQAWDPSGKDGDPRYSGFGLAPKTKADFAFLLHDLFHLKPDGIMTIVLPHGVLFRGGEEGEIRKHLIERNHIDAIIGLPANIFFGTGIPTIIMVLKRKRDNTDVLIIDASKGFAKVGKNNQLRASDIKRIADTVASRESIDSFSRLVPSRKSGTTSTTSTSPAMWTLPRARRVGTSTHPCSAASRKMRLTRSPPTGRRSAA